jgi:hypothetical protein
MGNETRTPAQHKALEEGSKLFHETFKHVTTLSSGSILLIATFFEKLGSQQSRGLAIAALVGFILSTIGSVALMLFLAKDVAIMGVPTKRDWVFTLGSWVTAAAFVVSVIFLSIFAAINLLHYTSPATHT